MREQLDHIGRAGWLLLHTLPYSIDDAVDASAYRAFARSLFHLYPCSSCRHNLRTSHADAVAALDRAADHPLGPQDGFALWAMRMHNAVSRTLRKEELIFPGANDEQAASALRDRYEPHSKSCSITL